MSHAVVRFPHKSGVSSKYPPGIYAAEVKDVSYANKDVVVTLDADTIQAVCPNCDWVGPPSDLIDDGQVCPGCGWPVTLPDPNQTDTDEEEQ